MDMFIFIIGILTFIISIVYLVVTLITKKFNKQTFVILLVAGLVLPIVGLSMASEPSTKNKPVTSVAVKSEEKTEEKKTPEEIAAENKAKEEATKKAEEETKKAEEERKAKEIAEAKKQEELIKKNTKQLSAGEHIVGKHIDAGAYDITFNGSGNFVIYDKNSNLLTNEMSGSDLGIAKYRAVLVEGSKIQLSGMSANTKPVKRELTPYQPTNIYAGYWIVGQDLTAGRYKATVTSGSGNFVIYDKNGMPKTNEILGGDLGVKEVVINLEDEDIVNAGSLREVKLVPTE